MIAEVLIERSKTVLPDGAIVKIVVWKVPQPVPGSALLLKYRLFYVATTRVAYLSPDREMAVRIVPIATNHQLALEWPEGNEWSETAKRADHLAKIRAEH